MFIARENEINELESRYQSRNLEFAIIYGRRRIGKTRLIEEFAKDKRFFSESMIAAGGDTIRLIDIDSIYRIGLE